MISIIISSANASLLADIKQNIIKTVGVIHEILDFPNYEGKMGMSEVYNLGAEMAKYNILCYMHEDLDIKTYGWGEEVVKIFNENNKIGIIGVAGGVYKSKVPSGWFSSGFKPNLTRSNMIQSFKHTEQPPIHVLSNPDEVKDFAKVVSIDGMWFCTLKSVWNEFKFDEGLLKGFHGYDLDYCLSVQGKYDVVVTYNILIEHFSEGGYNRDWLADTMKLHSKWGNILPLSMVALSDGEQRFLEKFEYKLLLQKLVDMQYSFFEIGSFLFGLRKSAGLKNSLFFKLLYYCSKFLSAKRPVN